MIRTIKGYKMRVTRTDHCGKPLEGPKNRFVTDGFISIELNPNMKQREELEQTNAEGRVCFADSTPPERKWHDVTGTLCGIDPELHALLTSWAQVLDYADKAIGVDDQPEVDSMFGCVVEVWTGAQSEEDCEIPVDDSVFSAPSTGKQYGYWVFGIKEVVPGSLTVSAQVNNFTFTAITMAIPRWGRGVYNVAATDSSGTPGRMLSPMTKKAHYRLFHTPVPPPEATDGAAELLIQSLYGQGAVDDYYGAGSADVAPAQPGEDEAWTLTVTGTSGDYLLTYRELDTTDIAYDADAAAIKAALVALDDGFGASDFTVTGAGPFAIVLHKGGTFAVDPTGLSGGTATLEPA